MKKLFMINTIIGLMLFANSVLAQKDIEKSFSVKANDNLSLSTRMGNIAVESWNNNEINIFVKNILESELDLLSMKQSGNKVEVKFKGDDSDNIEFEIKIPADLNLELSSGGGNITLNSDLNGNIDISTAGGNIRAMNIDGNVDFSTAGGNIKISDINSNADISTAGGDINIGAVNGLADISTAGGNIKVGSVNNSADVSTAGGNISVGNIKGNADVSTGGGNISVQEVSGSADISTGGGNIKLEGATGKVETNTGAGNIKLKNIKGSIEANSGAGNIYAELLPEGDKQSELNVGVGDIKLKVPETANITIIATIHVTMWSGDESDLENINSDFTATKINRNSGHKKIEVIYELNGGGNKVEVNTGMGKINIQKL